MEEVFFQTEGRQLNEEKQSEEVEDNEVVGRKVELESRLVRVELEQSRGSPHQLQKCGAKGGSTEVDDRWKDKHQVIRMDRSGNCRPSVRAHAGMSNREWCNAWMGNGALSSRCNLPVSLW